jgi:hypothetical protein
LLAAGLSACYSPYEPDCGFVCGSGGACPEDYTCAADRVCHLDGTDSAKVCPQAPAEFDIVSAVALRTDAVAITFNGVPNPALAQDLTNYDIPGLMLAGNSMLAGETITIGTAAQADQSYTITISNITRLTDGQPLTVDTATFTGRKPFDIVQVAPPNATSLLVGFSDVPDAAATDPANYFVPALGLSSPVLAGTVVTLTTDAQLARPYTLSVSTVKRASDGEPLHVFTGQFTGIDHCTDTALDGDETDTDCGGPTCTTRCANTQSCAVNTDCASNNCAALVCAP